VPTFASPSDAKSYISGLDFLIAGRMHACIAAYSAKVPFVATAYSRKFSGLFGMLEYPAILSNKGMSIDEALKFASDALASRDQLRDAIDIGMDKIDHLLGTYEAELAAFFLHAARKRAS
jgi:polysaccharide pyruvyl transferase WcaK-like protein